jgi:hypothetical protein
MWDNIKIVLLGVAILIAFLFAGMLHGCKTLNTDGYLQKSNIDPRKTVVYDKDAKDQGYLQESYLDRRRTTQYDKKGKVKGYWQQDYVDPRKTRFYKKK